MPPLQPCRPPLLGDPIVFEDRLDAQREALTKPSVIAMHPGCGATFDLQNPQTGRRKARTHGARWHGPGRFLVAVVVTPGSRSV